MTCTNLCTNFKFGFCKYGQRCWKRHVETMCENSECDTSCEKRHPIRCKYYQEYKRCKFGTYCSYKHETCDVDSIKNELDKVKLKLKNIDEKIDKKNEEMKNWKDLIKKLDLIDQKLKEKGMKLEILDIFMKGTIEQTDQFNESLKKLQDEMVRKFDVIDRKCVFLEGLDIFTNGRIEQTTEHFNESLEQLEDELKRRDDKIRTLQNKLEKIDITLYNLTKKAANTRNSKSSTSVSQRNFKNSTTSMDSTANMTTSCTVAPFAPADISTNFKCALCELDCVDEENLESHWFEEHNEHLNSGEEELRLRYQCEACKQRFKTASLLRRHTKTKHG